MDVDATAGGGAGAGDGGGVVTANAGDTEGAREDSCLRGSFLVSPFLTDDNSDSGLSAEIICFYEV